MTRISWKLALLAVWAASGCAAAKTVTIDQLNEILGTSAAGHRSDADTARRIAELELSERITEDRLAALQSRAPGPQTAATLEELMDQSAFLEPPPAEFSRLSPPPLTEQKSVFDRASTYLLNYARRLPNLICSERILRFDDDPARVNDSKRALGRLHFLDVIAGQVTYTKGREDVSIKTFNGKPYAGSSNILGLSTGGEFGNILISLFLPSTAAKARWSHWEVLHGRRVAVFHYSVAAATSQYVVSYCCQNGKKKSLTAGYQGFVFIEAETGTVMRVTRTLAGVPADFPVAQANTAVDYGPVTIGGASYMCPIRSVTQSDNLLPGSVPPNDVRLHSLNEIQFSGYRKFEANSKVLAEGAPDLSSAPATVQTAAATPLPGAPEQETGQVTAAPVQSAFSLPAAPPFHLEEKPALGGSETSATYSEHATFRERVNIVTVPVVVRDRDGNAVAHLTKRDFELLDNGKRQLISNFAETGAPPGAEPATTSASTSAVVAPPAAFPDRYVALVFDDIHIAFPDLSRARTAAERALKDLLDPGTRIAILTTSGQVRLNFTNNSETIVATLNRLRSNPLAAPNSNCPDVGFYQADRMVNGNDEAALAAAIQDAIAYCGVDSRDLNTARNMALAAARQSLSIHEVETRSTLDGLRVAARGMSVLPGERSMVFISPGFYISAGMPGLQETIDRAARSGVMIHALNSRGLYGSLGFDGEHTRPSSDFERQEELQQRDPLVQLADATGGKLFQNSNDYEAGFRHLAERPGVMYLLAFSPAESKADDSYHKLKVLVKDRKGLEIQARHGYMAHKATSDTVKEERAEIENALLSRDDLRDIPVSMQATVLNSVSGPRILNLKINVDARRVQFQKVDGRNRSRLRLTYGLFDENGTVVSVMEQDFPLDFDDKELQLHLEGGLNLRSDLKLEPACQFLRMVLRDADGQMTTENRIITQ